MIKRKVWGPLGYNYGPVNSLVGKGESIINFNDKTASFVKTGKIGKDTEPSSVKEDDDNVILGNDINWTTGNKFSQDALPYTNLVEKINNMEKKLNSKSSKYDSLYKNTVRINLTQFDAAKSPMLDTLSKLADQLKMQHRMEKEYTTPTYAPQYDSGKQNSASLSPWFRALPHVLGLGTALRLYNYWKNEPVLYHSTYAGNPYSTRALSILANERINPYNAINLALNAERRAAYRLAQSGGMTAGLRQKARVAAAIGNAANMANIYTDVAAKNSALRTQYADALTKVGEADASRRMNANQHDWADYIAAHGRKTKGIEQSLANIVGQAKDWYSNEFKYNAWRDTVGMYNQALDQEQLNWLRNYGNASGNYNKTAPAANTYGNPVVNTPVTTAPSTTTSTRNVENADIYGSLVGNELVGKGRRITTPFLSKRWIENTGRNIGNFFSNIFRKKNRIPNYNIDTTVTTGDIPGLSSPIYTPLDIESYRQNLLPNLNNNYSWLKKNNRGKNRRCKL